MMPFISAKANFSSISGLPPFFELLVTKACQHGLQLVVLEDDNEEGA
jgi:hypothetical protein